MNDDFLRLEENIELLQKLYDAKILSVNECRKIYIDGDTYRNYIEFIYQKDGNIKELCIFGIGEHNKFMECSFEKLYIYEGKLTQELCKNKYGELSIFDKYDIVKSDDLKDLKDIIKIEFYNHSDGYSNKDTIVIHSKNGNYFINVALYDSIFIDKYIHKFLPSSGVKNHIENYGAVVFSKPTDIISQWYICSFKDNENVIYNSSEQYMMAQKAKLFHDNSTYKKILKERDISKIKKLGKKVNFFDQELWDENKEQIVYYGNLLKFLQNSELKSYLLSTDKKMIIESNPNDIIWACGLNEDNNHILEPFHWRGDNILGEILMIIRDVIIEDDQRNMEDFLIIK